MSVQEACDPDRLFAAAAFRDVLLGGREAGSGSGSSSEAACCASRCGEPCGDDCVSVTFAVRCHRLLPGQRLCLTGAPPALRSWNAASPVGLTECAAAGAHGDDACEWRVTLPLPRAAFPLRFRFLLADEDAAQAGGRGARCVEAEERCVAAPELLGGRAPAALLLHCAHFRHSAGPWRGAGLAVPVFSLRSAQSLGCGDFEDLRLLVDLAAAAGLRVVQLLPVNDTRVHGTWWDSYPYSCLSTDALHPLYLRVQALCSSASLPPDAQLLVAHAKSVLDALPVVDYEAVLDAKLRVARICFQCDTAPGGPLAPGGEYRARFQAWREDNAGWLQPYAAFCFLQELFGTADHREWGALSAPTPELLARITHPAAHHAPALHFTAYLQWHLHTQLAAAAQHARSRRVLLKGDLPIGVDKRSVDTWLNPQLFRMDSSAGAPPDAFDGNGQNWGFPTYNWEEMARTGYTWWAGRLRHMSGYFSALRVDHVLGFFRIWELPAHAVGGLLGRFRPAQALTRAELEARGLWDIDRLTQPYIRRHLLVAALGARAEEVACRFMTADGSPDRWRLRPEFSTEAGILGAEGLQPRPGSPAWLVEELGTTRSALLALLRNVVLLRDGEEPGGRFHPRFDMEQSSSFLELEGWQRDALSHLAHDYWGRRQQPGWRAHARTTLPPLQAASGMLLCGEDLGLVPPCVSGVLQDLGVLSLRIQRMPPATVAAPLDLPASYPHAVVCSPSCHDVTTTRAWWNQDARRRQQYAALFLPNQLGGDHARADAAARAGVAAATGDGSAGAQPPLSPVAGPPLTDAASAAPQSPVPMPATITHLAVAGEEEDILAAALAAGPPPPAVATPELMSAILALHLASPAALAIFPIQDLLALDGAYCAAVSPEEEQINDPTVKRHYWRYRMRDSLESLAANAAWVEGIRAMVANSGRDTVGWSE